MVPFGAAAHLSAAGHRSLHDTGGGVRVLCILGCYFVAQNREHLGVFSVAIGCLAPKISEPGGGGWEHCCSIALLPLPGVCHEILFLSPRRAIMSLPLAALKELAKLSAPKAKGVILDQQNQVANGHKTKGSSLTNKHWAAFDLRIHGF